MKNQREIKFRAWDKKVGEMLEVYELYLVDNSNKFGKGILDEHNDFHPIDKIELMQSTGLLDKNGKEIFESDILTKKYYYGYNGIGWIDAISIVEFGNHNVGNDTFYQQSAYGFYHKNIFVNKDGDQKINNYECEIIGNIYENPELLKYE